MCCPSSASFSSVSLATRSSASVLVRPPPSAVCSHSTRPAAASSSSFAGDGGPLSRDSGEVSEAGASSSSFEAGGTTRRPPSKRKVVSATAQRTVAVYVKAWSSSVCPSSRRHASGSRCSARRSKEMQVDSSRSSSVRRARARAGGWSSATAATSTAGPSSLSPRGSQVSSSEEEASIGSSGRLHSPRDAPVASTRRMSAGVVTSRVRLASSVPTRHSASSPKAGSADPDTSSLSTGSEPGRVRTARDEASSASPRAPRTDTRMVRMV
mmetsp:Transcript_8979/g.29656  ORF Transcript_8979/g.29656 Transcript_8979/m.29656 type:complete len:268 (+) Transcript_8979:2955-3758(+)